MEFFTLGRSDVQRLAKDKPQIAEELVEYCRKRMIANLLRTSALFRQFDDDTRFDMIGRFKRLGFQPGARIIEQGQPGKGLYVLATGEVEVSVVKDGQEPVVVANLNPGQVFGEISLLRDQATNATVSARGAEPAHYFSPARTFNGS
ncbi:MAG: cyclic nucleotide-binding domain-containing protein [Myxococcota bacterium]